MKFIQINLNKTKQAAVELHNKIIAGQEIVLITEPYLFKNRVVGLPKGYQAFIPEEEDVEEGERPNMNRAAILIPGTIKAVRIDSICNRDCVAVKISTSRGNLLSPP